MTHHLCLLFLESLTDTLTSSHEFLDAAGDATSFAGDEGFGGEVVDAGVEAVGYEVGEHLWMGLGMLVGGFWDGDEGGARYWGERIWNSPNVLLRNYWLSASRSPFRQCYECLHSSSIECK